MYVCCFLFVMLLGIWILDKIFFNLGDIVDELLENWLKFFIIIGWILYKIVFCGIEIVFVVILLIVIGNIW